MTTGRDRGSSCRRTTGAQRPADLDCWQDTGGRHDQTARYGGPRHSQRPAATRPNTVPASQPPAGSEPERRERLHSQQRRSVREPSGIAGGTAEFVDRPHRYQHPTPQPHARQAVRRAVQMGTAQRVRQGTADPDATTCLLHRHEPCFAHQCLPAPLIQLKAAPAHQTRRHVTAQRTPTSTRGTRRRATSDCTAPDGNSAQPGRQPPLATDWVWALG